MSRALIVTGGSRGIGAATAVLAAARGWAVVVNYAAHPAAAATVVRQIEAAGGRAIAVAGDVSVEADVLGLFDAAVAAFGGVDGLVNNAGILAHAAPTAAISVDRWDRTMAVNLRGTFLCSREAIRRMSTRHGGSGGAIVNITSPAAWHGCPGQFVDYAASKGAIDAMTTGLARELAGQAIRVNAVRPGIIPTAMQRDSGVGDRAATLAETVPIGRTGRPEEVAEAVCWLLSEAASYVVGATLDVTGGYRGTHLPDVAFRATAPGRGGGQEP